jgi:Sulfotransferase domain
MAQPIVIVSGLPRSGTSVMMQLIHAGGVPALADDIRMPDEDNPRGYFEFERVKQIKTDKSWLADAPGKVVKMVHLLLMDLPPGNDYRVVFLRRDLNEVLASQKKMLARSGRAGAALNDQQMKTIFTQQIDRVLGWMRQQPNVKFIEVNYRDLIENPNEQAKVINAFLGGALDESKMAGAVDPNLYRNRDRG